MSCLMDIPINIVQDANHLKNLYAHISRTNRKYDAIRDDVDVFIAKSLNTSYNDHMGHIVVEFDTFGKARVASQYVSHNLGNACYAATAVGGAQPDGSFIEPCIHVIFDANYSHILSGLLNRIEL